MNKVDLSSYNNSWFYPGANKIRRVLWYIFSNIFVNCSWNPSSMVRVSLLRFFGAYVGTGVVIKPSVNIKYPWNLSIGDYSWIGENVWVDNLGPVSIGNNVCISQGAMLLCGNHNYKRKSFDLIVSGIRIEDGSWVGAKSVVCPGVTLHSHAVLSVGAVANHDLDAYYIYQGNPATKTRFRMINEE